MRERQRYRDRQIQHVQMCKSICIHRHVDIASIRFSKEPMTLSKVRIIALEAKGTVYSSPFGMGGKNIVTALSDFPLQLPLWVKGLV